MEKFILWCINHNLEVVVEYEHFQDTVHFVIFRKKDTDPDWLIGKMPKENSILPSMRYDSFHACIDMFRFKELDEKSKKCIFDEFTCRTKEFFNIKE